MTRLRIWQQNLNTSSDAQHCILSRPSAARDWDIIAIQEPTIDTKGNTRATPDWHVVYPMHRYTQANWRQLPFPSADVVIIQFTGPFGKLTILNIYNDGDKQDTPPTLHRYLESNICTIQPTHDDHVLWLGDFNCHHVLWEEERNRHLCEPRQAQANAQAWIELMADYGMCQALVKDKPTLQSTRTGNWTQPDNVFCTEHTLEAFTICDTAPRLCPPKMDHIPILSTLDLDIPQATTTINYNYQDVDWEKFNSLLRTRILLR
ncbi:DNase I-like protein [Suillus hirtellus]|nr:DNase I-like protein [Suillus hirtellus]